MAMIIKEEKKYTVSELIEGFLEDTQTGQVTSMNGRLNIRPAYQREFVWDKGDEKGGDKQKALIDSILHNYPINVMYFVKTGKNDADEDMYEVLDGQQRIITMAHFKESKFSIDGGTKFGGLRDNSKFLDYSMFTVYVCESDDYDEKMMWFERINTSGESLSKQEMRSAIASGAGTTLAKKYFVNTRLNNGTNAWSYDVQSGKPARDYTGKQWVRQEVYEQVITWYINSKKEADIRAYMLNNKDSLEEAESLFSYFKNVIKWVKRLFPTYYKDMSSVDWGFLYNKYHDNNSLASSILEPQIKILRDDIGSGDAYHLSSPSGIYEYVLAIANGEDERTAIKYLQRRAFTDRDKRTQYEKQHHVCPHCMKRFENILWMDGDHIIPYSPIPASGQENGKTSPDNLQMLCHACNSDKRNHPFNKKAELKKLKKVYEMSPAEVAQLPEGSNNG